MDWLEDLERELHFKNQERSHRDEIQHTRLLALQEQGPLFLNDLKRLLRSAVERPAFKNILLDDATERSVAVRSSESRPIIKVSAHLSTTCLIMTVATCPSAAVPYVDTANHRIEFGLDVNGKLSLCMECEAVTLDDIAKLMLRHVLGLA